MIFTSNLAERTAVAAVVAPGARAAGAGNSGWVDLALYQQLSTLIATGTLGAGATVDGKYQLADDSSGTNAADISGGVALTQIVKASGDNKQAWHHLDPNQLPAAQRSKRWARYVLTVGTATSDAVAVVFGVLPRHMPATDFDPASVVQSVNAI